MRMNHLSHVRRRGLHLHGKSRFMNHVGGMRSDDVRTQHAIGFGIGQNLYQPHGFPDGVSLAQPGVSKPTDFGRNPLVTDLPFRQTHPPNLRQRKDAGRHNVIVDGLRLSNDVIHRDLALRRRDVGQHGLAHDVADGIHPGHVGLQELVDDNLSLTSKPNAHLLQSDCPRITTPPHRHDNRVTRERRSGIQIDGDVDVRLIDVRHGSAEQALHVAFVQFTFKESRNLFILTRQQTRHHFHDGHVGPQRRVEGSQFTTFDSTADNEQSFGYPAKLQCLLARHNGPSVHGKHRKVR